MDEALAELAGYFRRQATVPARELVQLAAAARAGGSRWDGIAAACGIRDYRDITGVAALPCWRGSDTGAALLFSAAQHAVHQLTGSRGPFAPLSWPCPGCRQQVTDRAFAGRPVHIEHGHAPGCPRLARDQAADDNERRGRVPGLIAYSEDPAGLVQRHWLAERIEDDCPRCGWHGYFHHHIATIDDDWAAGICDDCYADLHPAITVTARYFSACSPLDGEPVAVIRQRTRSDYPYPDLGQMLTGGCPGSTPRCSSMTGAATATKTSPRSAASRPNRSPPDWRPATGPRTRPDCHGSPGRTRNEHQMTRDATYYEDLAGRLYGLLITFDDRLPSEQARLLHRFIEVGEYGLALEEITGALAQHAIPITDQERGDILGLGYQMKLQGDLVPRAVSHCPRTAQPASSGPADPPETST